MVTGSLAGSRIKTKNFKRRLLPHHILQRRDIWCTNSPVIYCFNPKFVDRSVPYEAKQRRVNFRRCFGNTPRAADNVSVTNIGGFGTEPKAPVTDYRNRGKRDFAWFGFKIRFWQISYFAQGPWLWSTKIRYPTILLKDERKQHTKNPVIIFE